MILSTQVVDNKDQGEDSSSESDIKNEGLNELKNIIKSNLDSKKEKISQIGKKSKKNITNLEGGDDSSYNLSKIEFKNQSINSSMRSLSCVVFQEVKTLFKRIFYKYSMVKRM